MDIKTWTTAEINIRKLFRRRLRFHQEHMLRAKAILKNIESVKGKTDPKLIKLSDEYAKDVLGRYAYAPWLYVYSAVAGTFREGWIPDNYYGKIVISLIQGRYGGMSALRASTNMLFGSDLFPDIAYYVNGMFLSHNSTVLRDKELQDVLFNDSDKVVYKADSSSQGKGIFFFNKKTFDAENIRRLGNGVFQNYIDQHPSFEELMPSSVATLRLTTIMDKSGKTSLRACYLRIGRGEDTHVQSAYNIRIPVNLKSGELEAEGFSADWHAIDSHPDTGIKFAKRKIHGFNDCVSAALSLHVSIPFVHCVGWDMTVDRNDKVRIMEWNGLHNDIKFSEATQGPCFSDLGWEKLWRKDKT